MSRSILEQAQIHPAIRAKVESRHADIVQAVQAAIGANAVVVVGMTMNPYPGKARKLLDGAGVACKYLEYGSYFSQWQQRGALKMWSGWPTFPMVFVKGTLIGGASELKALIDNGELSALLAP